MARAQPSLAELEKLRRSLEQQIIRLRHDQQRLQNEFRLLDQKNALLDRQLRQLRATGTGAGVAPEPQAAPVARSQAVAASSAPTTAPASPPAASPAGEATAPISGPSPRQQEARRTLQSAPTLASTGGVLTPKDQIVIDPSIEYDYWSQNTLNVNGFQIIPGIVFGTISTFRQKQQIATAAVTIRAGITDRLEVNLKIPYVYAYQSSTSTYLVQGTANQIGVLTPAAHGSSIGDIQFGASYQFNSGEDGWPIFVGNLLFKTATGVSPFDVPIYTTNDTSPDKQYLLGISKKSPTGTGFYALEPSLTVLYPTAPGVLFANLLFIENFSRSVNVQQTDGTVVNESVHPGEALAITFGIGFSLNENTSMTFSYQQEHVFAASENGQSVKGSAYDFGTFNFGLGYQFNRRGSVNLGVGVGAGPDSPVAKILLEVPYHFSL
ncbi:MAG: hypothetical protein KGL52_15725 [Rhodospirillales bacterium]|nr:hypothetical protein [Rhodospirillales bacterium]